MGAHLDLAQFELLKRLGIFKQDGLHKHLPTDLGADSALRKRVVAYQFALLVNLAPTASTAHYEPPLGNARKDHITVRPCQGLFKRAVLKLEKSKGLLHFSTKLFLLALILGFCNSRCHGGQNTNGQ